MPYQTSTPRERVKLGTKNGPAGICRDGRCSRRAPARTVRAGRSPTTSEERPMKMSVLLAAICAALPASVLADVMVGTEMQGFQEVPSVSTKATGRVRLRINRDNDFIDYKLSYSGL